MKKDGLAMNIEKGFVKSFHAGTMHAVRAVLCLLVLSCAVNAAQLSEEDLAKKREGWYPIGLPLVNFSSDDGFGYGARVYLFNNGARNDPYYNSAPYFFQLYAQFFQTTGGVSYHELNLDMPYLLGSKFRLRSALLYDANINANFFGTGREASDSPLTAAGGTEYDTFQDYYDDFLNTGNPDASRRKYNSYTRKIPTWWMNVYRDIAGSFKLMAGVRIMKVDIESWDGREFSSAVFGGDTYTSADTLLDRYDDDTLAGFDGGWTNFALLGIAFDTRDFEPNPKTGVLMEYTIAQAGSFLGSDYTYRMQTASFRGYYTLLGRLTFAFRGAYLDTNSSTPFYELGNFNLFTDRQRGLGGNRTNLGYKAQRFIGNTLTLAQLDARFFVGDITLGSERFGLMLLGFAETGNVYDAADEVYDDPRWSEYKTSFGGGIAIPWNLSTIVHFFVGISGEDMGISIDFDHRF